MTDDAELLAALAVIQARGAIGERSLVDAVAHADRFVDLVPASLVDCVDLGSAGDCPALVIAWRRPDVRSRWSSVGRHEPICYAGRLRRWAWGSDERGERRSPRWLPTPNAFDVVTARSFGDVAVTAGFIDMLLAEHGVGLVSEPPTDRTGIWAAALAVYPVLVDDGVYQGIRRLIRG